MASPTSLLIPYSLNFDDTYDALGDRLDEAGDAFNDDTFGEGGRVGKDFDFFGNTNRYAGTLEEEQALHYARQPPPPAQRFQQQQQFQQQPKQARSGYENYSKPEYIPQLEANASIWGLPSKKSQPQEPQFKPSTPSRKMMSLEEVEASMRAQSRPLSGVQNMPQQHTPVQEPFPPPGSSFPGVQHAQHTPRQPSREPQMASPFPAAPHMPVQPPPGMQNPGLIAQQLQQMPPPSAGPPSASSPAELGHASNPSYSGPPITQAQQMMQLSDEQRSAILAEEAKRAKRNHKIFLLSKDNGLMTPQDKNFITRIQLQQLLTATGGVDEQSSDAQLAEDFYYQVYAQIRGAPRQHPHQPLNQFAQTYLFQTGGRYGGGRRHPRGGDNHMQRMEQQVQRAVEAAKARPKNRQLIVEGSLGKIAFSNSKTPRPLLSFKRPDSESRPHSQRAAKPSIADRKSTLRNIENVYETLMQMEDHERHLPPPPNEESHPDDIQRHIEWRQRAHELNQKLWFNLRVMEPIQQKYVDFVCTRVLQ